MAYAKILMLSMNERTMGSPVFSSGLVFLVSKYFPGISCIWHKIPNQDRDV